ncbi:AIR synthase related protein [Geosporobacter ferrireducens]|uniref:PurM-like N-terminal domain-containing protein n=1 Tax=Geosporobacter ferrireducens TaxID=1424294 RepID=A0A1D8GJ63_9FIRM|nr:AIR synthase related protein [Geosporobacter ferrireducens]AOT70949.1 hypothetical protein Gferi_16095 [Geosporobacter ferrireducens]MTI53663.1 alpha-ribazole kinase [Geosporobacter ferrireducens]
MESKHRDISLVALQGDQMLVIACDSCGAVGSKAGDQVKVPPHIVGKYTTRVAVMEVMATGAKPVAVTANICNEPSPTGEEIMEGIRQELEEWDLKLPITISTEKNMPTAMTALGITLIGTVAKSQLMIGKISPGDLVYSLGLPKIGDDVAADQGEIADARVMKKLLQLEGVKEIIPVGSSGIKGEVNKLAEAYQLRFDVLNDERLDMEKSAGPCTVVLVVTDRVFANTFEVPCYFIGKLE